jgi:hypothetical protein
LLARKVLLELLVIRAVQAAQNETVTRTTKKIPFLPSRLPAFLLHPP